MRYRKKDCRQTERTRDREGEHTAVSSTSIVGCGETLRDSQFEGWMEKEAEDRQSKGRKRQSEDTKRKKVLETEQASMSRVSTAGSEVFMTGIEGASGEQMWANVCVHGCHSPKLTHFVFPCF